MQADSPEKAIGIIEDIKLRKDVSAEDLESVIEIEEEIKENQNLSFGIFMPIYL